MTSPSIHDLLRERLHLRAGLIQPPPAAFAGVSYDALRASQWSLEFENLMRNRLCMGALRYGLFNSPNKPYYNMLDSIQKRLDLYRADGNDEHLVDIANLAMCEFLEGKHPRKHFAARDEGPGCWV